MTPLAVSRVMTQGPDWARSFAAFPPPANDILLADAWNDLLNRWLGETGGGADRGAAGSAPDADESAARLKDIAEAVIALHGTPRQRISVALSVKARCPAWLRHTMWRLATDMLGNAVRHGLYARSAGHIEITLDMSDEGRAVRLVATDDGWGPAAEPRLSGGLAAARIMAEQWGGSLALVHGPGRTVTELLLPSAPSGVQPA